MRSILLIGDHKLPSSTLGYICDKGIEVISSIEEVDSDTINDPDKKYPPLSNPPTIMFERLHKDLEYEDCNLKRTIKTHGSNCVRFEDVRNSKVNPKIERNSLCPCGSGKKYKRCCINK